MTIYIGWRMNLRNLASLYSSDELVEADYCFLGRVVQLYVCATHLLNILISLITCILTFAPRTKRNVFRGNN